MNRTILQSIETATATTHNGAGYPTPAKTSPDRCSFFTILKLRELKRRRRRVPEGE